MQWKLLFFLSAAFAVFCPAQEKGQPVFADHFDLTGIFAENWTPRPAGIKPEGGKVRIPGGGVLYLNRELPDEFHAEADFQLNQNAEKGFCGFRIGKRHFLICHDKKSWIIPGSKETRATGKTLAVAEFAPGEKIRMSLLRTKNRGAAHYVFRINGRNAGELHEREEQQSSPEDKSGKLQIFSYVLDICIDDFRLSSVIKGENISLNLQPNSSFEYTDDDGFPFFWRRNVFDYTKARTISYEDYLNTVSVDTAEYHSGKQSLRLTKDESTQSQLVWGTGVPALPGTALIFSLYMKADRENLPVTLRIEGMAEKPKTVNVGTKWTRYEVAGNLLEKSRTMHANGIIRFAESGTLWIDDVQTEITAPFKPENSIPGLPLATPYHPAAMDREKFSGEVKKTAERPRYTIPRLPAGSVAGKSQDSWKQDALRIGTLFHGSVKPTNQTELHLACDSENLYVGYRCFSGNINQTDRKAYPRDFSALYARESVEFFLDPAGDGNFYQLLANPGNTQLDFGPNRDPQWNGKWKSSAVFNLAGKSVDYTIVLPFSDFACAGMKREWPVNFCRNDYTAGPRGEHLSIVRTPVPEYQNTKYWASLILPEDIVRKYALGVTGGSISSSSSGTSLQLAVQNNTGKTEEAVLKLRDPRSEKVIMPEIRRTLRTGENLITLHADTPPEKLIAELWIDGKKRSAQTVHLKNDSPLSMLGRLNFYMNENEAVFQVSNRIAGTEKAMAKLSCGSVSATGKAAPRFKISLPLKNIPFGKHTVKLELEQNGMKAGETFAELVKLPYREGATQINRFIRSLHRNGKNIFVLSPFFVINGRYGHTPEFVRGLADWLARYGFRSAHVLSSPESAALQRTFLDSCAAHGINVMVWSNYFRQISGKIVPFPDGKIRELITKLDTRNILSQMVLDEPELGIQSDSARDYLRKMRAFFPYTPVHMNNTILGIPARYAGLETDLLMLDDYLTNREGRTVFSVVRQTDAMREAGAADGVPCFFFLVGNNAIHSREPTYGEQIAQSYGCIASGCTGISWYLGTITTPGNWKAVTRINREILALSDILLSEEEPVEADASVNTGRLRRTARKYQGYLYLITCNIDANALGATEFLLPDGRRYSDQVEVLFENRILPLKGRKFSDCFGGHQRHVYKVKILP